jgi:hypothetical protein
VMENIIFTRRERIRLALSGKINLRPAYAVMMFNLVISYVSSIAYGRLVGSGLVSMICEFGFHHIPAVQSAAALSRDANACAFVMTFQWLLSVLYLVIFGSFLSPFSSLVRVAVDKSMHRGGVMKDDDRGSLVRIAFLVFVPVVFLGDIGLVHIPTFLNGGLFAVRGGEAFVTYFINSAVWMPIFLWLVVIGTFLFYWSWIHLIANYKTIFNV